MNGILQRVRANVGDECIASCIHKEGCRVLLNSAPRPRLIVDLDGPGSPLGLGPSDVRCDYLFVANDPSGYGWVAPLELKSGRFRTDKFVQQIEAGTRAAEKIIPSSATVRFRPIAVYGGVLHSAERYGLKRESSRVVFHGIREPLRLIKCGDELTKALL